MASGQSWERTRPPRCLQTQLLWAGWEGVRLTSVFSVEASHGCRAELTFSIRPLERLDHSEGHQCFAGALL